MRTIEDCPLTFGTDNNQQLCTNCNAEISNKKPQEMPTRAIAGIIVEKLNIAPEQAHVWPGNEFVFRLRWTALLHNSAEKPLVFQVDFAIEKG